MLRDVALLFAGASFDGPSSTHRIAAWATCKHPLLSDDRPAAPYGAGRALTDEAPISDVPLSPASTARRLQSVESADRPGRCRPFGFHLQVRTASRTPGEERTLRTIQNAFRRERPRTLSRTSWSLVAPVKVPRRTSHTVSPSFVPPRASTPTTISLGLDLHALTRWSRCVRPTSANHCLPETCTRALGFRPAWSRAG